MKFRNYCVVILGDTKNVKDEIQKVSETEPNILDAKGIVISTFSSLMEPVELNDWFVEYKRSFLIFDLNDEGSRFNITKEHIHEGLFGFLRNTDITEMTKNFAKTLEETGEKRVKIKKNKLNEETIKKMTKSARQNLLDSLIDEGIDKLTEDDKKLLHLLVN